MLGRYITITVVWLLFWLFWYFLVVKDTPGAVWMMTIFELPFLIAGWISVFCYGALKQRIGAFGAWAGAIVSYMVIVISLFLI